ncbi:hypothetical protein CHS0354_001081 [Potamilus streckersoni]|uniref:Uncharacterized protein n=1 Tax=Potamilus streckersoni TaxID=2493646 RepID=A0AAE0RWA8_9BIVA|nr:hypothetical protein CHS0354_001081 [Potamilus streckersoni]
MDVGSRKGRFSTTLLIIVCYVTSKGKTETADSSFIPYFTTLNETTDSSPVYDTTTHNGMNTEDTTNIACTTGTLLNGMNARGTYQNGTNSTCTTNATGTTDTTGSIPLWIPTIVISVICGLLFVLTITTIVCHRCHNRKIANSDVESVRSDNEYINIIMKELHQTNTNPNKSPNKECSKAKPSEKEEKTNINIASGRGDYDEVLLDGTPGSTSEIKKKQCQALAKSNDVLNRDGDCSDIEANEDSLKKESSEQRESPVYTQSKKKHVYSHVPSKLTPKNKAESFATSGNQIVHGSHEDSNYYDHADLNAKMSVNADHESLNMDYDHLPNIGPKRDFTSQPLSIESMLLVDHYDNGSKSFRNAMGASKLYSKVSARRKNDQEADTSISGGELERDDSNHKVAEKEKVMAETDTNVYYNIDKLKNSSKSTDKKHDAKPENKTIMTQYVRGFKTASQKQDADTHNKSKELSSFSGKANFGNTNVENMQNETGFAPNISVKNDGRTTKSGEIQNAGSKFRIKETNYEESTKPQKSIRSDYEEVETVLG